MGDHWRLINGEVCCGRSALLAGGKNAHEKKVSGRCGFRPLGRGDGGKRNLKLFLTSRRHAALASSTPAHRSRVNRPGSRDQLPITVAIVLPTGMAVDSSVVPSHPVLSDSHSRTVLPVPLYRWPTHTRNEHYRMVG